MILCITWLSLIVGLGARCCVLDSTLFSSLKCGCPHLPQRAAGREGELLCQALPPLPCGASSSPFAVTLFPRGPGQKVQ